MINYDVDRARAAVQFLVDSPYYHHHLKKLRSTVSKPRALPFKEGAEPLNELLVIGRQNMQALENLIEVAEVKRGDRNDYQRQFMAAKRQRDRKVFQLEELMTGKKPTLDQRNRVIQRQYEVWNKERTQHLETMPGLSWAERNERIRAFWARKEAELDALIAEAKLNGPIKRKYVVKVEQKPKGAVGQALASALQKGANNGAKPVDRRR